MGRRPYPSDRTNTFSIRRSGTSHISATSRYNPCANPAERNDAAIPSK